MEIPTTIRKQADQQMKGKSVEGFVLGGGNEKAKLMIVGEAPGENEVVDGKPFTGRAGKELDRYFEQLGISREEVYITSAVRSRPYKWVESKKGKRKANRKPNQSEIIAHAPILDYQIQKIEPRVIIALGGVAYKRLTGRDDKISERIGQEIITPIQMWKSDQWVETEREYTIVPIYHPAAVFYNPGIRDDIVLAIDRMKGILESHALLS